MTAVAVSEADIAAARTPARFYYGWVNLLMASVAMTATLPGRTHGLGLITKPMIEDPTLAVDQQMLGYLNCYAILIGAAICFPIGKMIDRFGVRFAVVSVGLILGFAVAAQSQVTSVIGLLATLILVRGFGQGALSIVSTAMIGKWFTRRLGLAMGLFSVLLSIGFIATILGVGSAVKTYGWRETWLTMAGCLVFGLVPLGWLFVRNSPESMGIAVDLPPTTDGQQEAASSDATLWEALETPSFWIFTLSTALFNLTWSAITLFQELLLVDQGFDHNAFLLVMSLLVAAGLPANLLTGWLATPKRLGLLLAVGMIMLAGSLIAFPWLRTNTHLVCYGTALGISGGIITVIHFSAYGQTFGRTNLGAIQATVQSVSVLASASGPVLFNWSKSFGSNSLFFYGTAATTILLAGLSLSLSTRRVAVAIE